MKTTQDIKNSTIDEVNNIQFSDIFNLEEIQHLQNIFSDASGVASIITHPDGTPITNPNNFCRLCSDIILKTEKGRANCYCSDSFIGNQTPSGPATMQCMSIGLLDTVTGITVGGKHVANWVIGQVRNEELDEQLVLQYADEIGANREDFIEALSEVPVMSVEQFNKVSKMLVAFSNELSKKAYNNLQLKIQITEQQKATVVLEKSERLLSSIYDTVGDIIFHLEVESVGCYRFISVNQTFCKVTGLCEEMVVGKLVGEVIPEPSRSLVLEKYKQAIKKRSIVRWVETSDYPTGQLIGDVCISPVFDEKGHCTHLVGSVHDITGRKKAENALKETNNKLIQAQRVAKIGSWENSLTTNDLQWSEEMYHILGFPPNMSINLTEATRIFPPEEIVRFQQALSNAINKDVPYSIDYKIVRLDGSVRYIHDEGEVVRDEHGQAVRMIGTTQDITDRRRAEDKLSHVTRLYVLLSQINQAIVRIQEQDELFRTICQVAIEFGQFRMAWIGLFDEVDNSLKPVTHSGQEDGYLDQITIPIGRMSTGQGPTGLAFQEGKVITSFEIATDPRMFPWRDKALKRGYLSSAAVPFRRKGKTVGTLTLYAKDSGFFTTDEQALLQEIGEDISFALDSMASETERKLAEEQIIKLSNAVEQAADTIFITNLEGIIEYTNPAFETITGYSKAETLGNTPRILKSGLMDLQYYKKVWETILSGKVIRGEVINRSKNGKIFYYDQTITPLMDVNGKVTHFISTGKDITERKRTELILQEKNEELTKTNVELIKAKEKAEESDKLKTAFLNNISHEIRTPFNSILGFLSILLNDDLTAGERAEYTSIIDQSAFRLINTFSELIEISEIQTGQMKLTASEINIKRLAGDLFDKFKADAESQGLDYTLDIDLPNDITCLSTDSTKLNTILSILIGNAIKFTKTGSIEFGCDLIEAHGRASLLQFFVKDTGIGIPLDRQEAIFELFIQADFSLTRPFEGAGLGLSIATAYVEMLGGKIWVESEEGKGSAFYFTLPYNTGPDKNEEIQRDVPEDRSQINPEVSGLKILIVEDDKTSELFLRKALKLFSKEILHARTGTEAVETSQNNPDIDLILMNIKMPGLNGYDATMQIRQFNKKVVIIAQTAFGLEGDQQKALAAGCNDYIFKPVKKNKLINLVEKYFRIQEENGRL